MQSPTSFDGKMVRLRATVVSGFEILGIHDPQNDRCGLIWLTDSGGGPVASISFGSRTPNLQRPIIKPKNNRQLKKFHKLLNAEMYPRTQGSLCIACNRYEVTATLTGRLDYAGKGLGFGHANHYETQLVLESVSDVNAVDQSSHYDLKEISPTPVRFPTGYLKGRVVGPDGRPVAGAEVNVHSTEDVADYMHHFTERADEKGRFKVAVPPGTYVLGINLETPPSPAVPFAAAYYPGMTDEKAAKKLSVADGQNVTGLTIRIPERLRERKIPVKVTWPDGKPVENANVWLADFRNPSAVVGGGVNHTIADGTFDLIGFEGIDYFLHGNIYVKPLYKPHCAEVRTLNAGDPIRDRLVLVLTLDGEVCQGE